MSVEIVIQCDNSDSTYHIGDTVTGSIVVNSRRVVTHNGLTVNLLGKAVVQLSARNVGLFDALYASPPEHVFCSESYKLIPPGKFPMGMSSHKFKFEIKPREAIFTYHGVYITCRYSISCELALGIMASNVKKQIELYVVPKVVKQNPNPLKFELSNKNVTAPGNFGNFLISGKLENRVFSVHEPMTGNIVIHKTPVPIQSVELQLMRIESCMYADGEGSDTTNIQSTEICSGNVCKGLEIPIHMIFPRHFCCPTTTASELKIEFELRVIVEFANSITLMETLPLTLV